MKHWVKVCPKCGSKDVEGVGALGIADAFSNLNFCKTCGFQGPLFPEISPEEAEKIKTEPPRFNPDLSPSAAGQRSWIMLILLLLVVIFSIFVFFR
jgi:hypothetical protein